MKTRKNIITILTLCAALSLTACSGKDTTEKNPKKKVLPPIQKSQRMLPLKN